ncbi:hypothetical protein XENOCAPTIV_030361, partial [Xenoophorus captivus]
FFTYMLDNVTQLNGNGPVTLEPKKAAALTLSEVEVATSALTFLRGCCTSMDCSCSSALMSASRRDMSFVMTDTYRTDIEIIFNIIDKDHSGLISIEEFRHTWRLFSAHLGVAIDDGAIDELAHSIDFNKDGSIDFTEFLEAFRVVHKLDIKEHQLSEKMAKKKYT